VHFKKTSQLDVFMKNKLFIGIRGILARFPRENGKCKKAEIPGKAGAENP
jgi:hypothetical protein